MTAETRRERVSENAQEHQILPSAEAPPASASVATDAAAPDTATVTIAGIPPVVVAQFTETETETAGEAGRHGIRVLHLTAPYKDDDNEDSGGNIDNNDNRSDRDSDSELDAQGSDVVPESESESLEPQQINQTYSELASKENFGAEQPQTRRQRRQQYSKTSMEEEQSHFRAGPSRTGVEAGISETFLVDTVEPLSPGYGAPHLPVRGLGNPHSPGQSHWVSDIIRPTSAPTHSPGISHGMTNTDYPPAIHSYATVDAASHGAHAIPQQSHRSQQPPVQWHLRGNYGSAPPVLTGQHPSSYPTADVTTGSVSEQGLPESGHHVHGSPSQLFTSPSSLPLLSPKYLPATPPPPASAPSPPASGSTLPRGSGRQMAAGFQPDYDRGGRSEFLRRPGGSSSLEGSAFGGAIAASGGYVRPPPAEAYLILRPHRVPRDAWKSNVAHTVDAPEWTYSLVVLQQPERGKALGVEQLRRGWPSLSPPLIIQLLVTDRDGALIAPDNVTLARRLVHLTLNVELVSPESGESRSLIRVRPPSPRGHTQPYYPSSAPPPYSVQRTLIGSSVRTAQVLTREGRKGLYFIFQDLIVRPEGRYALEGKILDLAGPPHIGTSIGVTRPLASCRTGPFDVIIPQEFPGSVPITALSAEFLRQGERHLGRRPRNEEGETDEDATHHE